MIEKERKIAERYAKIKEFKLNQNKEELNMVLKGLEKNREKYGVAYCPCRVITRDKVKDKVNICPCKFHLEEIKKEGYCKCRLFWRK